MQPSLPSVLRKRARRLAFTLRPLRSFFAASAVELSEGFQGRSNPLPQRTQRKTAKIAKARNYFSSAENISGIIGRAPILHKISKTI
jgi:hypothetical protein